MKYFLSIFLSLWSLKSEASCVQNIDDGDLKNSSCITNEYNSPYYSSGTKVTQTSTFKKNGSLKILVCTNMAASSCKLKSNSLLDDDKPYKETDKFNNGITVNAFSSRFDLYN